MNLILNMDYIDLKGFNADFTEFIGEIYIPYKPLVYKAYKFAEKSYRSLRTLKKD